MNDKANIANMQEFTALSKEDRLAALKDGRFIPPKRGTPERAEFEKQAFSAQTTAPSAPAPAAEKPTVEAEKPAPISTEGSAPAAAAVSPAPVPATATEFLGFKTPDEAKKAFDDLKALTSKQAELINKLNSTASNLGRERANLQAQLEAVSKKITEKGAEAPVEADIPEPPDPAKFADQGGVVSDEYQAAVADYSKKLFAVIKDMRTTLKEVKPKLEQTERFVNESATATAQTKRAEATNVLNSTTTELQKTLFLETSVPWETINNQVLILQDVSSTPEAKAAAQGFINSLPKEDVEKFNKLHQAVSMAFDFSTGTPQARYDVKSHQFKGALIDAGFTIKAEPGAVDLEKLHQTQQDKGISGLPPNQVGSDEPPLSTAITGKEKQDRLALLNRMRAEDPVGFRNDSAKWHEYIELRKQFGTPVPASQTK